ncbi:M23 family metallopeptidase [Polyangium aurulentum]|uniref:M23 family metallopeptidase n=1 Tax=Polyangium aurulentum TaxID=2567896 RepID=UPI00146C03BB|nr:M23 family metallopeptidase [Polyangium aurulentum]UQA62605.1 peptidoglycan DD-metalloendopeptidase family protein [Polyangium aurulentum]
MIDTDRPAPPKFLRGLLIAAIPLVACGPAPSTSPPAVPPPAAMALAMRASGPSEPPAPELAPRPAAVEPAPARAKTPPAPEEEAPRSEEVGPRSGTLPSGFFNPMPGGVVAGYRADTGLDIAGVKRPVHAIASGRVDYAEAGHTLWTGPRDTANCVRIQLDAPIDWGGRKITHVYYAHLSELSFVQPEGAKRRRHVEGGERIGTSGVANGSWHLHVGLLLDGEVEQTWGTFLFEDEVRKVLGDLRKGSRLPEG